MDLSIKEILTKGSLTQKKALFLFNDEHENEVVLVKFNLWARYNFHKYFTSDDADFHEEMDELNLKAYRSEVDSFTNIAFRGAAKTARTKLFLAFCIANDEDHMMRYLKVLSYDKGNSTQIVTDIYNMLISPKVSEMYPEIFVKTKKKREETMSSFTTSTGVRVLADTVGTDQRGSIQEDARPDFIWFEDFENRKTLRSGRITKTIWDNMEEARTGLAMDGVCVYTCNYISEAGNVHKLVVKQSERKKVLIIPIIHNNIIAWPERYSIIDIDEMREDDEDFEGERLCKPSASKDVFFDRETLDNMLIKEPVKVSAGFKIFKKFNPSHRYGSGHDVAGGVGLDSSTSVFIDFSTVPANVVATFKSNEIRPGVFGDEIARQSDMFGGNIVAPEKNNHGHATILRARQLDVNLYTTQAKDTKLLVHAPTEFGWHTNTLTKPKMLFALSKAIEDGFLLLNDPDLIAEAKSYTRHDLMDKEEDARLTTRHFDLLVACAIAWQMKDHAQVTKKNNEAEEQNLIAIHKNQNKSHILR